MKIDTCDASAPIDQLKAISSWVSSVQDLDKLLQLIIESATGVVCAEAASLLLLDPKTNTLFFKVATGSKGEAVKDFRVKIGQGIAGHVAKTGHPLPSQMPSKTTGGCAKSATALIMKPGQWPVFP